MRIVVFVISIMLLNISLDAQWEWKNPYPQGNTLVKVQVIDENIVYVIGENQSFIKSTDGGETWDIVKNFNYTEGSFNSMDFITKDEGIICGDSGLVIQTTDGGYSWEKINTNFSYDFIDIQFTSSNEIFLLGDDIIKSVDGGLNWVAIDLGEQLASLRSIYFINSNSGWLLGLIDSTQRQYGEILKTEDGGNTWLKLSTINRTPRGIQFYNEKLGWMTANNTYYRTEDGGINWEQIFISTYALIYSISFIDSNKGWAAGSRGEIYNTTDSGKNWIEYQSTVRSTLLSIQMINDSKGWTVGEEGRIFKTTDGGSNWINQSRKLEVDFRDVEFRNKDDGWLLALDQWIDRDWKYSIYKTINGGDSLTEMSSWLNTSMESIEFISDSVGWAVGTKIYKTSDGGYSWTDQSLQENPWLYDVCFVDENYGWTVGLGGNIYKTTNSGNEWGKQSINTSKGIISIKMIDKNTGWCAGENGLVFNTTNGGTDWIDQSSSNFGSITAMNFVDENTGWIASDKIFKTTNAGQSWVEQAAAGHQIHYIEFIDEDHGYAAGNYGLVLETEDGGGTWSAMTTGTKETIWSGDFYDLENGWLVGNDGLFLKLDSEIVSVEERNKNELPNRYLLFQNYPNPFNPTTKIKFSIPSIRQSGASPHNTKLVVYDILGREIKTLLNKKLTPGRYEVEFEGSNLSSGVYLYRLQIGDTHIVKKMMLLK